MRAVLAQGPPSQSTEAFLASMPLSRAVLLDEEEQERCVSLSHCFLLPSPAGF